LYHDFQAIDPMAIREHGGDHDLKPCGALLHVILRRIHANDVGTALVLR
jgi:hypothetical protein